MERAVRSVGTIHREQFRNGRRPPDYVLSRATSVSVIVDSGSADLDFVLLAVHAGRQLGRALEVDQLLDLSQVRREGQTTAQVLALAVRRHTPHAADVLEEVTQAAASWSGHLPPAQSGCRRRRCGCHARIPPCPPPIGPG